MVKQINVLLTRHHRACQKTQATLTRYGANATLLPMSKIVPLDKPFPHPPDGEFDGIIFTSPLAPQMLTGRDLALVHLPVFCVGAYTARCAKHAGFTNIINIKKDAETLTEAILHNGDSNVLLYPCAQNRSFDFAEKFLPRKKYCTLWEIYINQPVFPERAELVASLEATNIIFVFSKRTGEHFFKTAKKLLGPDFAQTHLGRHRFVVISPKVATCVPRFLLSNTYIANEKSEKSMIECLGTIRPGTLW